LVVGAPFPLHDWLEPWERRQRANAQVTVRKLHRKFSEFFHEGMQHAATSAVRCFCSAPRLTEKNANCLIGGFEVGDDV